MTVTTLFITCITDYQTKLSPKLLNIIMLTIILFTSSSSSSIAELLSCYKNQLTSHLTMALASWWTSSSCWRPSWSACPSVCPNCVLLSSPMMAFSSAHHVHVPLVHRAGPGTVKTVLVYSYRKPNCLISDSSPSVTSYDNDTQWTIPDLRTVTFS